MECRISRTTGTSLKRQQQKPRMECGHDVDVGDGVDGCTSRTQMIKYKTNL